VEKLKTGGKAMADAFVSNIYNILFVVVTGLSAFGILFAPVLAKIAAPGFSGQKLELTISLSRYMVLSFPCTLSILLYSYLQNANNRFFISQTPAIFSALFVILGVVFFAGSCGIYAVVLSLLAASLFSAVLQRTACRKLYHHSWLFDLKSPDVSKMVCLAFPVFCGFAADEINIFVNSMICTELSKGSVSHLNYAQRIIQTFNGTCMTGILTVLYPLLATIAVDSDVKALEKVMKKCVRSAVMILLPAIVIIACYGGDIVRLIFGRGNFTAQAAAETGKILVCYSFALVFLACRELFNRVFFAMKEAKTPAVIGAISAGCNIIFSLILVRFFGACGLAAASVIAACFTVFLQYTYISRKIIKAQHASLFYGKYCCAIAIGVVLMLGLKLWFAHLDFTLGGCFSFLVPATVSLMIYFAVLFCFNLDELEFIKRYYTVTSGKLRTFWEKSLEK
jgi:putative peptidoglycan lipid II flippase